MKIVCPSQKLTIQHKTNVRKWQEKVIKNDKTHNKKLIINDWVRTIKPSPKEFNLSNPLQIVSLVRPGVYK
ncbi:hypothetical protein A3Q56_06986 [Intoshia linei]|uniref:Uncharacterized protein n=1 Tax=Intoshia linei TaxID=1819745 RepID=A0A177ATI3_9BILA|nr:hypothetical protein A3Q56_06986 [Intoshia linei]